MTKIEPNSVPYLNRVRDAYMEEKKMGPHARAEGIRIENEMLRKVRERTDQAIVDAAASGAVRSHIYLHGLGVKNPNRVYAALTNFGEQQLIESAFAQTVEVFVPTHFERMVGYGLDVLRVRTSSGREFDVTSCAVLLNIVVDVGDPKRHTPEPEVGGDDQKLVDQNWSQIFGKFVETFGYSVDTKLLPLDGEDYMNVSDDFRQIREERYVPDVTPTPAPVGKGEDEDGWGDED